MAEELIITATTKAEQYAQLLPQIQSVIADEPDPIANMANTAAMLHQAFRWWWVGFYRVADAHTLVLGPFQGPLACTRIRKGRGVCGTAWQEDQTQVVPDVDQFPGHIACSSASRSEIVVPVHDTHGTVVAVLDIDSDQLNAFDETDRHWLEQIAQLLRHGHS
ncbi:MAG: GAF domain-containing protein [Bacteroidaceae bacterium]|nr:GAF domain-containing protein [Bacteroidaceae bacterium]MBQ9642341.1 GAF domain-containing protein [Bacteroidaceae bacterium]